MVIQRWQSVLLFLAGLAICFFGFIPVCDVMYPDSIVYVGLRQVLPLFILDMLIGLLLFIAIFLYHNLKLQKRVVVISIVLTVVLSVCVAFGMPNPEDALGRVWRNWIVLPIITIVLAEWGLIRIKKDEATLRSYDRIR